jgi:hypothetical protein
MILILFCQRVASHNEVSTRLSTGARFSATWGPADLLGLNHTISRPILLIDWE